MKYRQLLVPAGLLAALGLWSLAAGKDEDKNKGGPPVPAPGPEHEVLKQEVGVWDATVEMWMAPGAPPEVSKGVETNTLGGGGLWLISDFKGEAAGRPFHGHGMYGYDTMKKKYVGVWTDSMATMLQLSEGDYDKTKKTFTMSSEMPGPDGKLVKMRMVTELKDKDTRTLTFHMPGPDGKELAMLKISYKRRK